MDQQDKQGPGLHKEVSTIFEGVPLPNGEKPNAATGADPGVRGTASPTAAQAIAGISAGTDSTPEAPRPHPFSKPAGPERPRGVVKPISKRTDFLNSILERILPANLDDSVARRQKVMALLIPVLAVILILVFVKVLGEPARSDAGVRGNSQQATETESETEETAKKDVNWELPEVISKSVRDPMMSKLFGPASLTNGSSGAMATDTDEQRAAKLMNLEVTGILWSKEKPAAIVGTEIVHEGDTVLGAVVVKINKDSIELELDGRKWTQGLHP